MITIKQNKELQRLAQITGKTPQQLVSHLLIRLTPILEFDPMLENDLAGKPVLDIIKEAKPNYTDPTLIGFLAGRTDPEMTELFKEVLFWDDTYDCPECGSEGEVIDYDRVENGRDVPPDFENISKRCYHCKYTYTEES